MPAKLHNFTLLVPTERIELSISFESQGLSLVRLPVSPRWLILYVAVEGLEPITSLRTLAAVL